PAVSGLGVVRRAWAKREDYAEFFYGQPPGTATGCQMIVQLPGGADRRLAGPSVAGRRLVRYTVELHCFVWSTAPYVEDTQDFMYALRDALIAKVRADPTLGSGGIEAGQFHVGEGGDLGGDGEITWDMSAQVDTEQDAT